MTFFLTFYVLGSYSSSLITSFNKRRASVGSDRNSFKNAGFNTIQRESASPTNQLNTRKLREFTAWVMIPGNSFLKLQTRQKRESVNGDPGPVQPWRWAIYRPANPVRVYIQSIRVDPLIRLRFHHLIVLAAQTLAWVWFMSVCVPVVTHRNMSDRFASGR